MYGAEQACTALRDHAHCGLDRGAAQAAFPTPRGDGRRHTPAGAHGANRVHESCRDIRGGQEQCHRPAELARRRLGAPRRDVPRGRSGRTRHALGRRRRRGDGSQGHAPGKRREAAPEVQRDRRRSRDADRQADSETGRVARDQRDHARHDAPLDRLRERRDVAADIPPAGTFHAVRLRASPTGADDRDCRQRHRRDEDCRLRRARRRERQRLLPLTRCDGRPAGARNDGRRNRGRRVHAPSGRRAERAPRRRPHGGCGTASRWRAT